MAPHTPCQRSPLVHDAVLTHVRFSVSVPPDGRDTIAVCQCASRPSPPCTASPTYHLLSFVAAVKTWASRPPCPS